MKVNEFARQCKRDGIERNRRKIPATWLFNDRIGYMLIVGVQEIHDDFTHAADAHLLEAKNALSALIYDVTQNVKPGSENAVLIVKAAIDNAFRGYEQVTHATRDAVKQVEAQIAKATEVVSNGAGAKR